MGFTPKHTKADREIVNFNGLIIPNLGVFVVSGSVSDISGSTTGSDSFHLDALAVRMRRVEVFHSGAASKFNLRIESASPNTGSLFDARNIVTEYCGIPGSVVYEGLDQIEDIIALTDKTPGSLGNIYLKFMPHDSGLNDFKYMLFFEAVMLYIDRDPKNTRVP